MDHQGIMFSEVSKTGKGKYCMVSYVKSKKRKEKKVKVIETGSIKLVSKG